MPDFRDDEAKFNTFLYSIKDLNIIFNENIKIFHTNIGAKGVCIDTRKLKKYFAFIAIKGQNQDGHNFIKKAIKDGASLIICSELSEDVKDSPFFKMCNFILVPEPKEALTKLAQYNRNRSIGTTKLIAITGSIGKTTTKELLKSVTERFFDVHCTEKNYNSQIGQPLTLANVPLNTNLVILEAGMSKPGELRTMSKIAKPDISIITTIANAHSGHFC
jgi:UDP-N-acetylmuramoyl-tripeptide--D-alanyl-D-alanine ligase